MLPWLASGCRRLFTMAVQATGWTPNTLLAFHPEVPSSGWNQLTLHLTYLKSPILLQLWLTFPSSWDLRSFSPLFLPSDWLTQIHSRWHPIINIFHSPRWFQTCSQTLRTTDLFRPSPFIFVSLSVSRSTSLSLSPQTESAYFRTQTVDIYNGPFTC